METNQPLRWLDSLTRVVVYTKEDCHLCENVISILRKLSSERALDISTQDITASPELFERYKHAIPVVEIDGEVRLGGSTLSNHKTLEDVLRKAVFF
jgi:glutaredoxin